MSSFLDRYHELPDDELKKAVAEIHKYQPDAAEAIRSSAVERGFSIEELPEDESVKESIAEQWLKRLLPPARRLSEEQLDGLLDQPFEEGEESPRAQYLRYVVMGCVLFLMLAEYYDQWSFIIISVQDDGLLMVLLLLPMFFLLMIVMALWKKHVLGYYGAAGFTLLSVLSGVSRSILLLSYAGRDLVDLEVMLLLGSSNLISVIGTLIVSIALFWVLCQKDVYRTFGVESRQVFLAFILGAVLIYGVQMGSKILYNFI